MTSTDEVNSNSLILDCNECVMSVSCMSYLLLQLYMKVYKFLVPLYLYHPWITH